MAHDPSRGWQRLIRLIASPHVEVGAADACLGDLHDDGARLRVGQVVLPYLEGLAETKGVDCVILDDVCTTGGSTVTAIERAKGAGMNILGAACVVDREQGGREAIEAAGCGFVALYTMAELLSS